MRTLSQLTILFLAACGSGVHGQVPRCQPSAPSGTVEGTIAGRALTSVQIACARAGTNAYVIALSGGACEAPAGDTLGLVFCTPPAIGEYPTASSPLQCPSGPSAEATIGSQLYTGLVTGSITITDDEPDCLAGTFDLSFYGTDTISGAFEARKL